MGIHTHHTAPHRRLESLSNTCASAAVGGPTLPTYTQWNTLTPELKFNTTTCIGFYLNNSISVIQGVPKELSQMFRHLFSSIDKVFRPNDPEYTHCKEPISLKKLCQGYTAWSTKKVVLRWSL